MNGIYENMPQIMIYEKINETMDYFRKLYNRIKSKSIEIKSKFKNEDIKEYEKEVESILSLMNKTADLIDESPYFKDNEYFDYLDLKEIAKYILKDINLFSKHYPYILELFSDFDNIVNYKFKCESISDYEKEYEKYKYCFNRKREFFYTEIYEHLGIFDELIDDIVNTLG
ncbi:MAG: hypothetical protein IJP12_02400 [Methanobrevibacter sp.]|nr:hypothetical protein [Methanobrevibacter sp.]